MILDDWLIESSNECKKWRRRRWRHVSDVTEVDRERKHVLSEHYCLFSAELLQQ